MLSGLKLITLKKIVWELGSVYSSDKDSCTLLIFSGKRNLNLWIYPEEVKVQTVQKNQIVLWNVAVKYHHQSVQIQCSLKREVIDTIESSTKSFSL